MKICIIGSGYVGLVTGTCLAEVGNEVWCVDADCEKIKILNRGEVPIYESGLPAMLSNNLGEGRLHFTVDLGMAMEGALFCFLAVGTPPQEDGSADLKHVLEAAQAVGQLMENYMIIVNKSTVPVGTAAKVRQAIEGELSQRGKKELSFEVVSNPEFLREGSAVTDFMHPDRIIIGADNGEAAKLLQELYEPFVRDGQPVLIMDTSSAELTKYAANAILATRISFMNELAGYCDKVGIDIEMVRMGIGTDSRIGRHFLHAGVGYGGSCLPKDVQELISSGQKCGLPMDIVAAGARVNEKQKTFVVDLIVDVFGQDLRGKTFALWGLAFKPGTDDMRAAPAVAVIEALNARGASIKAYDPAAMEVARQLLPQQAGKIEYSSGMMEAVTGADALILITEWNQFQNPDFPDVKARLTNPVVFDGRNLWDPEQMQAYGFNYYCIGRGRNGR